MTRVLLITDTERVQRILQALEEKGVLQLQTVSTLDQGELEISASSPDFTFVQSRVSGFSGAILLRHLDKILPKETQLVLLAGDAEDAAQAKKHGRRSLDLSLDDAALEETARALLTGTAAKPVGRREASLAVKPDLARVKIAPPPPDVAEEPEQNEEPLQAVPSAALTEQEAEKPEAEEPPPFTKVQVAGEDGAVPFDEVMRRASVNAGSLKPSLPEVEDRVEFGKDFPASEGPPDAGGSLTAAYRKNGIDPVPLGVFLAGESLAEAMRRAEKKKRRPYRIVVPVLVLLVCVPLFSYLAGRSKAPDSKTASPSKSVRAPVVSTALPHAATPVVKQPPSPATMANPQPVVKPEAMPETKPLAKPEAKPATKPTVKPGLKALPPFLEGTRLDAGYGKTHPGWVRYIGKRAEYTLFKEAELYRAMQVVALGGEPLPDQLFKRVLAEFGGIDSYKVELSAGKGDYLVEQCATKGDAALTIYRNKKNLKMKALVVYYR